MGYFDYEIIEKKRKRNWFFVGFIFGVIFTILLSKIISFFPF